jgi:pimeloyl-ACP methyl ester carboxylesterase
VSPLPTIFAQWPVIFVPGIEYDLQRRGWCDQAVVWCNVRNIPCAAYEYHADWWNRWLAQPPRWTGLIGGRARGLAEILDGYDCSILVGHSNGCDVIARALSAATKPVHSAHLFAAATSPDLEHNGLAAALRTGRLGRLYLYCSESDGVLRGPARWSRWLTLGLLGYGDLGAVGPDTPAEDIAHRVVTCWAPGTTHSGWLHEPLALDENLRRVMDAE